MKTCKVIHFLVPLPLNKRAALLLIFPIMVGLMLIPTHVARADDGITPTATPAPVVNQGGDMGPLTGVDQQVHKWGAYVFALLADMVVVTVAIVGMIQTLKAAGAGFLGMHGQTGAAIVGIVGLVLVVLITFVALPELIRYLSQLRPSAPF